MLRAGSQTPAKRALPLGTPGEPEGLAPWRHTQGGQVGSDSFLNDWALGYFMDAQWGRTTWIYRSVLSQGQDTSPLPSSRNKRRTRGLLPAWPT